MNTVRRIAKNTIFLLISQITSMGMGFFYTMYTARYLGAEGFGILSFALAFTGIFGAFADFGLSTLATRDVARDKLLVGRYLGNITVMKIFLAVITFGLIAAVINLLGYPEETIKVVYLIALSVIFTNFTAIFNSVFQAFEKMEYLSVGKVLNSILLLAGSLVAIKQGFGIVEFVSIYFIVSVIILGYSFVVCMYKFVLPKLEVDRYFWKNTLKEALPFFIAAFFSLIAFKIDTVMLSVMRGDLVVGWYSSAYRLMEILIYIPATYVAAIYPALSIYYITSKKSWISLYQKSFKYLVILGLPVAVGVTILADKIILIIYGDKFVPAIIALRILIWTTPVIFLTYMFGTMLASINKQNLILKTLFICMVLKIALNLILIPQYSYIGSSIATVFIEIVGFILQFYFLSKFIYKIQIQNFIAKPLLASIIMGLITFSLIKLDINSILLVLVSSFIYIYTLIFLKTFSAEDYDIFKQIISTKYNSAKL